MVTAAKARIWKPQSDEKVVEEVRAAAPVGTPVTPDLTIPSTDSPAQRRDSLALKASPRDSTGLVVARGDSVPQIAPAVNADSVKLTESFAKRTAVLNRELLVESDSIRLSFYDNGEIDGDSISVFVNHELVLSHQGLEAKAFNIYLHLDSTRDLTEVSMFAENLGRIPPNTALMVITDGVNRYEVFLSSSLTENATVELRRKRH